MVPTWITVDDAQEIVWDGALAVQIVSKHRWYTKQLVVFEPLPGVKVGFYYLDPASETQEDQDRFEADPVPIFPVIGRQVTTTVYEKAPDAS